MRDPGYAAALRLRLVWKLYGIKYQNVLDTVRTVGTRVHASQRPENRGRLRRWRRARRQAKALEGYSRV